MKKTVKMKDKKIFGKGKQKYIGVGGGAAVKILSEIGIVVALRPTVHEGPRRNPDGDTLRVESVLGASL